MVLPSHKLEQATYNKTLEKQTDRYEELRNQGYALVVVWYIVFLGVIPLLIYKTLGFEALFIYIPTVDLIANIFSSAVVRLQHVYTLTPWDTLSYVSTNFISLVALLGAAYHGLKATLRHGKIKHGFITLAVMFSITYLLPTPLIPWVISKINMAAYGTPVTQEHFDTYGLIGGAVLSLVLVLIEARVIKSLHL